MKKNIILLTAAIFLFATNVYPSPVSRETLRKDLLLSTEEGNIRYMSIMAVVTVIRRSFSELAEKRTQDTTSQDMKLVEGIRGELKSLDELIGTSDGEARYMRGFKTLSLGHYMRKLGYFCVALMKAVEMRDKVDSLRGSLSYLDEGVEGSLRAIGRSINSIEEVLQENIEKIKGLDSSV